MQEHIGQTFLHNAHNVLQLRRFYSDQWPSDFYLPVHAYAHPVQRGLKTIAQTTECVKNISVALIGSVHIVYSIF